MSMELKHLHLFIGTCLDLAERMAPGVGKELLLDLIDDFVSQAAALDGEGASVMAVAEPHMPGRDSAALLKPEKD